MPTAEPPSREAGGWKWSHHLCTSIASSDISALHHGGRPRCMLPHPEEAGAVLTTRCGPEEAGRAARGATQGVRGERSPAYLTLRCSDQSFFCRAE
eukprot:15427112-Alexandrium_andersonii.AAC.1